MTRSRPFSGQAVPADTSLTKLVREGRAGEVSSLLSEIGVLLKRQGSSGKKLEILGYCTVRDVVGIRDQLLGKQQQMRPGMKSGSDLQIVNMNPPAGGGRIRKRLKTHR